MKNFSLKIWIAVISGIATVLAAVISGVFLLLPKQQSVEPRPEIIVQNIISPVSLAESQVLIPEPSNLAAKSGDTLLKPQAAYSKGSTTWDVAMKPPGDACTRIVDKAAESSTGNVTINQSQTQGQVNVSTGNVTINQAQNQEQMHN